MGNTRSEEKNTILSSDLASKWNILEPINGISLNILGNIILYSIWASPRNMHIRIPHVRLGLLRAKRLPGVNPKLPLGRILHPTEEQLADRVLAFTRYCFTPKLSCTSKSSFYWPLHLHCSHYCNTIARLMRNIRFPPDPPCVCHTPYNIGDGNIV